MRYPYEMRGFPGWKKFGPAPLQRGKNHSRGAVWWLRAPLPGEGGRPAREPPRLQEDCKKRFSDPKKRPPFFRV